MVTVEDVEVTEELEEGVEVSEPVEVVEVEERPRSSWSPIDTLESSLPRSVFHPALAPFQATTTTTGRGIDDCVFVRQGKEHLLVTRNLVPGDSVYGEKRISIESPSTTPDLPAEKIEYRVWNPFRSKLAAGILGGLDDIHIAPGKKVLYIGAASGTSVSHVADVVGPVRLAFQLASTVLTVCHRRELSTPSNSLTDLVEISSTWPKSERTSFVRSSPRRSVYRVLTLRVLQPSLRTLDTRTSTEC